MDLASKDLVDSTDWCSQSGIDDACKRRLGIAGASSLLTRSKAEALTKSYHKGNLCSEFVKYAATTNVSVAEVDSVELLKSKLNVVTEVVNQVMTNIEDDTGNMIKLCEQT